MNVIDVLDYEIVVNGNMIKFPASEQELTDALGEPRVVGEGDNTYYIYDDIGISFGRANVLYLKKNKGFVDKEHLITSCEVYVCDEGLIQWEHAKKTYDGNVTFFGNMWESYNQFWGTDKYRWKDGDEWKTSHIGMSMRGRKEQPNYIDGQVNKNVYLSYNPVRPKTTENYNIVEPDEECLEFDNFNFKLAVIQELMYEQEVLKPYFDIYDYLDFKKSRANTESFKNVKPAVDFFKNIKIPVSLADKVQSINMDGGNDIYINICPMWDGEDDRFDLTKVSLEELKQFPNLKHITVMATDGVEGVQSVAKELGIEVEND